MANKVKVPGGAFYAGDGLTVDPMTRTVSGDVTTPDWNQNDETASDYIKNRPFYTGDSVQTVLVEESTVSFTNVSANLYHGAISTTIELAAGETYEVSWDGAVYECVCESVSGLSVIGNKSIIGVGADTGEPFVISPLADNSGIEIYTLDTSASHAISISAMVAPVVKIDEKYLPDALLSFKPAGKSYLTFSSPNSFTLKVNDATKHWDGTLEYFAADKTWATWDGTTTLSSVDNDGEYVLYLRGTGNTVIATEGSAWALTGSDIACIGNIENLLDYATVESGNHPTMAESCYDSMFSGCTSLTQAPALPATTLAYGCYHNMFSGCTGLKLSSTKTDEYIQEYRIPSSGNGVTATNALNDMFTSTSGTFTGTPSINTIYYLSTDNMIVRETDISTLNGYVGSMIDAAIDNYECIIPSSTPGSTKKFKITVDDSGNISATEVTA